MLQSVSYQAGCLLLCHPSTVGCRPFKHCRNRTHHLYTCTPKQERTYGTLQHREGMHR
jgi:hypothetical protein